MARSVLRVDVTSMIPVVSAAAKAAAERAVSETAREIEAEAKQLAAVDTGHMRNSILAQQVKPYNWAVDAQAEYSVYVEYGTSRMAAQPFMNPAAEHARPRLEQKLRRIV